MVNHPVYLYVIYFRFSIQHNKQFPKIKITLWPLHSEVVARAILLVRNLQAYILFKHEMFGFNSFFAVISFPKLKNVQMNT